MVSRALSSTESTAPEVRLPMSGKGVQHAVNMPYTRRVQLDLLCPIIDIAASFIFPLTPWIMLKAAIIASLTIIKAGQGSGIRFQTVASLKFTV